MAQDERFTLTLAEHEVLTREVPGDQL